MNIKSIVFLLCLFVLGQASQIESFAHEKTKSVEKTFPMPVDGHLNITNRYGSVNVQTWDKKQVEIKVEIIAKAGSEKKVQEILDLITIKFEDSANTVSAETIIENNNYWSWGSNTKFEINYEIFMPMEAFLNVENKYGNTYICSLDRDVNAEIKYGNIDVDNQSKTVRLSLGYGNGKLGEASTLNADIKYSNFESAGAKMMNLETKYSNIKIDHADNIVSESGYDQYKIGKVGSFTNEGKYDDLKIESAGQLFLETKYTQLHLKKLYQKAVIEHRYGEVRIDEIDASATEINVDTEYVDVSLGVNNAAYTLELKGRYIDYDLTSNFKETSKDKDNSEIRLKGTQGNGAIKILVEMEYGHLNLNKK